MSKPSKLPPVIPGVPMGRLTPLRIDTTERPGPKKIFWVCRCECGTEKVILGFSLRRGATTSCGCIFKKMTDSRRFFTPEIQQQIRDLYPTMGRKLAKVLGCAPATLTATAKKLGVKSLVHHKHMSETNRAKNTTYNREFFNKWSPELAYVLGYIWADGCIATRGGKPTVVQFSCVEDDRELLDKIAKVAGFTTRIGRNGPKIVLDKHGVEHACRPTVFMHVGSCDLAEKLCRDYGLAPNKSLADLPYPTVPDEFLSHFARGNLDGDGCVYTKTDDNTKIANVQWLGSHRFANGLAQQISRVVGVRLPRLAVVKTTSTAVWSAGADVLKLHEWVYKDATIWLDRKRKKFDLAAEISRQKKNFKP